MPATSSGAVSASCGPAPEPRASIFASVVQSVLRPTAETRAAAWRALATDIFDPLELVEGDDPDLGEAQLSEDGATLSLPAVLGAPALVARHKRKGRALFTRKDAALAQQLVTLAEYVEANRSAYDQGVNQERLRALDAELTRSNG